MSKTTAEKLVDMDFAGCLRDAIADLQREAAKPDALPEPPISAGPVDISWMHELGLHQKLSNPVRCF